MSIWKRGTTLMTKVTRNWSKEQFHLNERHEEKQIFSNFTIEDKGFARRLVCTIADDHPNWEVHRAIIENAPEAIELLKKVAAGETGQVLHMKISALLKKLEDDTQRTTPTRTELPQDGK